MKRSGCEDQSFTITSPIGDITIISCSTGLHSVKQREEDDSTFVPNKRFVFYFRSFVQIINDYFYEIS